MIRTAIPLFLAAILGACATPPMPRQIPSAAAIAELAPSGRLRAAINFGNPILANRNKATGEAYGVSVDLARELATRLGVPLELVPFNSAGRVVEGAKSNLWDVAFVAIDPLRAADMDYSAAYVIIEGAYLVPQGSPITRNEDVDREGVRVAVGAGSAYDLFLTRELKKARIVRAPTSPMVVDMMVAHKIDVAAGVKQQLEADAKRLSGLRLLEGRFMVINQAMATPKGRPAGARFLADFVEEMKASEFVLNALTLHAIDGATVAPPAR
jgi:polar amino acid transport system substrate-binding protein